jgi:FkbM family methyltransferase
VGVKPLVVVELGNFRPSHSTETHLARSLESLGHTVVRLQEDEPEAWDAVAVLAHTPDFLLWTRTWHLPQFDQLGLLARCREACIPTVAFHLDRWIGLDREHQIHDEAMFRCELVVTADGGHDAEWAEAGVNHLWMPPGVVEDECGPGTPRSAWRADVAFLGSATRYHAEWLPYRQELLYKLRSRYRQRFKVFPRPGQRQIRGADLADLFASVKVMVGDSCLAGGQTHYTSDRVPETLGRGGFLIHPAVEGMPYTDGVHLVTYELGNWPQLFERIDHYLAHEDERRRIAEQGMELVRTRDTYRHRMESLIDHLRETGMLRERSLAGRGGRVTVFDRGASATFDLREGSSDGLIVDEVWRENVYRLDPADVTGGVVVDLGANVGAFSLWALAHGAAMIHAYEPEPGNYDQLRFNLIDANRMHGWDIAREAVLGESGGAWMMRGAIGHEGDARVCTGEVVDKVHLLLDVRVASINAVLDRARHQGEPEPGGQPEGTWPYSLRAREVAVLKLDVEGSEYDIMDGLDPTLLRHIRRIVMEFHVPPPGTTFGLGAMVAKLAEHGHVEVLGRPSVGGYIWWRRYET